MFLLCYQWFQVSPSALAQNWTKSLSSIQHSPLWLNKCTTWNNLKEKNHKKPAKPRYRQKITYLLQKAYFNFRFITNQPSFLLLCWTFVSFFIIVLLQFSVYPAFTKKKMINDLNAKLPTMFSVCYYSAAFICKTIF